MILYRGLQDSDGNGRPYQFFTVEGPIETERTLIWWHWIGDWYGNWCSLNTASNLIRKWLLFGHGDWYGHGDGHGDGYSVNAALHEVTQTVPPVEKRSPECLHHWTVEKEVVNVVNLVTEITGGWVFYFHVKQFLLQAIILWMILCWKDCNCVSRTLLYGLENMTDHSSPTSIKIVIHFGTHVGVLYFIFMNLAYMLLVEHTHRGDMESLQGTKCSSSVWFGGIWRRICLHANGMLCLICKTFQKLHWTPYRWLIFSWLRKSPSSRRMSL